LPPDSGEKITLTITILLALTVFLQLVTEYTPKAAEALPIIGWYFNVNLILVLMSVMLTVIVLNFHFRGPRRQRLPAVIRKYVLGYIGILFCFSISSSFKNQTYTQKKRKPTTPDSIITSKGSKSKQADSKLNEESSQFKFESSIRFIDEIDDSKSDKKNNNDDFKSVNNDYEDSINSPQFTSNSEEEDEDQFHEPINDIDIFPTINHIDKNLERIFRRIENSLHLSHNDHDVVAKDLKISILKEILKCQTLMLSADTEAIDNSVKIENIEGVSIHQIHEEWKILAIIFDRICFVIYLSSLIISSLSFFLDKNIRNS
jgi:hypothetical protein